MIRIIICDDDPYILKQIQEITEEQLSLLNTKATINTYTNPLQISNHLLQSCDIALLDVDLQAEALNGMKLARKLRSMRKDAIIIFVTNFVEYALEGYEVQAFRYVLKKDMKTALRVYLPQALQKLNEEKEKIKVQISGEIIDLQINSILYLEVKQHYTTIFVQSGCTKRAIKSWEIHTSLSKFEKQLEPCGFLRIHRSYLVNMKYIQKFNIHAVQLYNGTVLRVSEVNYAENKQKYLFWKGCL